MLPGGAHRAIVAHVASFVNRRTVSHAPLRAASAMSSRSSATASSIGPVRASQYSSTSHAVARVHDRGAHQAAVAGALEQLDLGAVGGRVGHPLR